MTVKKTTVECGEALTIANVADLHGKFTKALEESSTVELDAKAVEKVDTAGLQLLVALNTELEKCDGKLLWSSPSDTLVQSVATLGLGSVLPFNQQA